MLALSFSFSCAFLSTFFCTNPEAEAREIIEAFADRAAIEQDVHDLKEAWGAGRQQVRNIPISIAAFNLDPWLHTLIECWAWRKDRASISDGADPPWDDPERRPSHADRNALRTESHRNSSKIRALYRHLLQLFT